MKNTIKRVHLTHHELLKLISIMRTVKYTAAKRNNRAESRLANELVNTLLDYEVDSEFATVVLDSMHRYSLWNYVEQYITFCSDNHQPVEYALAVTISTKLSG